MERFNEILNFILKKNLISVAIFLVPTLALVYVGFVMSNNVLTLYKDFFEIKASNEVTLANIEKKKDDLRKKEQEAKKEHVKEEKVPIVVYKPMRQNAPIESSAVDLVTDVIGSLERTHNSIMDISYNIIDTPQDGVPSNISIVRLYMTLEGTYVSFQDFLFELYDDQYVTTVKQTKMVPLQENKSRLEITTEIWLYISK